MPDPYNGLTPAQAERLAVLAEEAGEIVQIVGKILRHGYLSYHPSSPNVANRELLDDELGDLLTVAKRMIGVGDIEGDFEFADHNARWKRKGRYMHHQEAPDAE